MLLGGELRHRALHPLGGLARREAGGVEEARLLSPGGVADVSAAVASEGGKSVAGVQRAHCGDVPTFLDRPKGGDVAQRWGRRLTSPPFLKTRKGGDVVKRWGRRERWGRRFDFS